MRVVARPETASMPRRIGAPPVLALTASARSGPSTAQASRSERLELGEERGAPHHVQRAQPARLCQADEQATDGRVGDVLDHPIARLQFDDVGQEQECRGRVDAQHGGLAEIERGRHRDHVGGVDAALLGPVLALQVDDEVARLHVRDAGADRGDAPDALGARCRGQGRLEAIEALAERDVRRIDREEEDVEHDLARGGRADVGNLGAGAPRLPAPRSDRSPPVSSRNLLAVSHGGRSLLFRNPSQKARSASFGASHQRRALAELHGRPSGRRVGRPVRQPRALRSAGAGEAEPGLLHVLGQGVRGGRPAGDGAELRGRRGCRTRTAARARAPRPAACRASRPSTRTDRRRPPACAPRGAGPA